MRESQVGDLRIAYVRAGEGPPLVLVHGGITDSRSWRAQITGLSDQFTVLAWDAPGCGQSSDVSESWRLPHYADALAGWLDSIAVRRPNLLGLSWGSSIVLEFYRRYPHLPASLILASAYAGWAGSLPAAEVAARLESALAAADLPTEQLLGLWPGLLSSTASQALHEEQAEIAADNTGSRHPGGYRAVVRSMAEADLRDVLPTVQVPTLLLYGELDERSPLSVANELHARIPASELVVMGGVGHLLNVEVPAEFNAQVRRFLRSVDMSTRTR